MKTLYVLYDHTCGLCCRAIHRLANEPKHIDLQFLPAASGLAQDRFGSVLGNAPSDQVVAIADTGEVYRGTSAWLIILYSLKRYRALSISLARPTWRPLANRAIAIISRRRHTISELFGCAPDADILQATRRAGVAEGCASGTCSPIQLPAGKLDALRNAKNKLGAETAVP